VTSRTKIVATVGPASRTPQLLRQLLVAGVNVFRLNFSHGTHEEHSAVVADIRALSREMERHVAILQDLCGPKMRLNPFPGDVVDCHLDDEFTLAARAASSSAQELTCTYRELPNDLKAGETVLFADGTVAMAVVETAPGRARLRVTLPGRLRSRQGLNLPGSDLAVSSLTDKDLRDLDWTARHAGDIDFVGLSFARSADDVTRLREALRARNCPAHVVVKIEKPQAVEHLEEIVAAADAVMVARGDLGVEMDAQRLPAIQKRIIALCNQAHRPVITATQMLTSMEHSSRPTRAEVSDVFNAVLDGADAVMLSGESAVGEHPVEAVMTMRQICAEAEAYLKSTGRRSGAEVSRLSGFVDAITKASVDAACLMTEQLDATLIVVTAGSGRTALALSNRRPAASILALSRTEQVARSLSLCWGVTAVVLADASWAERVLARGVEWAKSHGIVTPGEHAVLLSGQVVERAGVQAVLAGPIT
jgi:pyruvate kinase